jgi:hypothetical protein
VVGHLQEGAVYVFVVGEVAVGDNFQLMFKINRWRGNVMRMAQGRAEGAGLEQRLRGLRAGALAGLTAPCIFRNYYKFQVVKVDLRFLYLKVDCERCEGGVMRVGEDDYRCRRECGKVAGRLRVWVIVGCMDGSGYAELTLEDGNALVFFGLEG